VVFKLKKVYVLQVTATAGMKVNLVDMNEDILKKSGSSIQKSLERVAKKKFSDNPEVFFIFKN